MSKKSRPILYVIMIVLLQEFVALADLYGRKGFYIQKKTARALVIIGWNKRLKEKRTNVKKDLMDKRPNRHRA